MSLSTKQTDAAVEDESACNEYDHADDEAYDLVLAALQVFADSWFDARVSGSEPAGRAIDEVLSKEGVDAVTSFADWCETLSYEAPGLHLLAGVERAFGAGVIPAIDVVALARAWHPRQLTDDELVGVARAHFFWAELVAVLNGAVPHWATHPDEDADDGTGTSGDAV